jgi:tRNA(Ile)-lysidine synthase
MAGVTEGTVGVTGEDGSRAQRPTGGDGGSRGRLPTGEDGEHGEVKDTLARLLARCDFPPPGTAVACAVSGGADSLALLALASAAGLRATAVHVDHGLRVGSEAEADVVSEAAKRLGTGFRAVRVEVAQGPNLEARARTARYLALPRGVLTGHTCDDQAETMLANLLRGAGRDGLAGMRPATPATCGDRVRRPLLGLRRAETRDLCVDLGLEPVEDPSNQDRRFVRNRIRHEVLPLLAEVSGRDPVPVLARQAKLMAAEADLLDELAGAIDPTDARALALAHPALARRAVRLWLRSWPGDPEHHPPSAAEVTRVLAVARGRVVGCELAGGRRVRRSAGRLHLTGPGWPPGPR